MWDMRTNSTIELQNDVTLRLFFERSFLYSIVKLAVCTLPLYEASHSLGVALHSGSGWLCRDPFFDIPKPLFVLKELICLTTCGDLDRSQKPNRFVCFVVCCHWRRYYPRMHSSRMHSSRLGDLPGSVRYAANWQTVDKQLADHLCFNS